jgi:hypothetical protein
LRPTDRIGDWRWRGQVAEAMAWLTLSRLAVSFVPFRLWRRLLGRIVTSSARPCADPCVARRLAASVERGALRLPFRTKCLPRALALHAIMRRRGMPALLVIGVLDSQRRGALEDLHAWVETDNGILIGAIAEPFHPLVRFG